MGNTCKSMANSCQCMTKPLQYCKVISLQLIKISEKKSIKKKKSFYCSLEFPRDCKMPRILMGKTWKDTVVTKKKKNLPVDKFILNAVYLLFFTCFCKLFCVGRRMVLTVDWGYLAN